MQPTLSLSNFHFAFNIFNLPQGETFEANKALKFRIVRRRENLLDRINSNKTFIVAIKPRFVVIINTYECKTISCVLLNMKKY